MKRWLFLAVFCLSALSGVSASQAATATLRTATEVDRAAIRLSDVFRNLPEGLDRDIATAPALGKSVTYDVKVLTQLAQQYRLDWEPQGDMDKCVLTRAAIALTPDLIRKAVIAKIQAQNKELASSQIEVAFDNRALEVYLPPDHADFKLNAFAYDQDNQRFRAELVAGESASSVTAPITGRVSVKREVPILTRRLDAGTIISESDLGWQTIVADHVAGDLLTSPASLVGHALRHDTNEDTPLRTRDIMLPRLVVRGTMVTMKVETASLQASAQGKALQDGSLGEIVRLINTRSNRVVEGTVTGLELVSIRVTDTEPRKQAMATLTDDKGGRP
jgi:flagella basal body P-ring formation protein FlgA